jgi:hypothetical protein
MQAGQRRRSWTRTPHRLSLSYGRRTPPVSRPPVVPGDGIHSMPCAVRVGLLAHVPGEARCPRRGQARQGQDHSVDPLRYVVHSMGVWGATRQRPLLTGNLDGSPGLPSSNYQQVLDPSEKEDGHEKEPKSPVDRGHDVQAPQCHSHNGHRQYSQRPVCPMAAPPNVTLGSALLRCPFGLLLVKDAPLPLCPSAMDLRLFWAPRLVV